MTSLADTPIGDAWARSEAEADWLDRLTSERSSLAVPQELYRWVRRMVASPDSSSEHLLVVAEMLNKLAILDERDGKALAANALQILRNALTKIAQRRAE